MSLLRRLLALPLPLAFRRTISTYRGNSETSSLVKIPRRFLQLYCKKLGAVVDITADTWSNGRKYVSGFEDIEELHNAPEEVKRVFSLQNASQVEHRKVALEKVKEQYSDEEERYIAELCVKIEAVRKNNEDGKRGAKNKHSKVFLHWLICKRRKKLQHLKDTRFERYLELLKELDLEPLDHPHSAKNKYKMRRRTTRQ